MDISAWLTDTITVAPFLSRDIEGKPSYGAQVTLSARVERKQVRVKNDRGEEVPSDTQIGTDVSIGPEDNVWFSGADITKDNEARTPVAVSSGFNRDRSLNLFLTFF